MNDVLKNDVNKATRKYPNPWIRSLYNIMSHLLGQQQQHVQEKADQNIRVKLEHAKVTIFLQKRQNFIEIHH